MFMKRLKFDHQLAELIRQGQKTSTWRLYDDKDISIGDIVELIDKVKPQNPATWVVIGKASILTVIEKRLADVGLDESPDHIYDSWESMLKDFQKYYGPQVDGNTIIKIVQFKLLDEQAATAPNDEEYTTDIKEVKIYADGGSRGNPGPSASGYAVMDMDGRIVVKKGVYLGVTTNNQAEYQALRLALEEALRMHVRIVHVYMDSLLVVNQMLGIFKVKNRDLWPIHTTAVQLATRFEHISYTHVPRTLNKIADAAVNEALDAAQKA
jgi:ribonuclease HI